MLRLNTLTIIIGSAMVVSSCGQADQQTTDNARGAQKQSATPANVKACDILTEADAEKALGRDAKRLPNDGGPAGLDICQYGFEGERIMDTGNVSLTVQPVDFASMKKGVTDQGYSIEPIPDVGDQAFWSKDVGLYVGKGNRTAIYLLAIGAEKESRERTVDLARATVERL